MKPGQAGIGILEILIGITLSAVIGLVLLNVITTSSDVFMDQTIQVNQGMSINMAAREITDLIKSSAGVTGQYPPSGAPLYLTGDNVIVLKLPAISQAGQIIDSVFDYAVILKEPANSKILRVQVFTDGQSSRNSENKILSTSLDTISYTYLDTNNNQISPSQAARINFIINLSEESGLSESESSSSGIVNIKNY